LASPHETRVVALEISRSRFVQLSVRRGANLVVTPICDLFTPQECANYFQAAGYGFK
jgi:hypothetical protein